MLTVIAIVVIIIIVVIFSVFKGKPSNKDEEAELYVAFNEPYFIKPDELVDLLSLLAEGESNEFTYTLILRGDYSIQSKIALDVYFSIHDYTCSIVKMTNTNDIINVELMFVKNTNIVK